MRDNVWWTWIINDLSLVYPSHVFIYAPDSLEWQCTCSFRGSSSLKDFDIPTLLAQIDLSASQQELLRNLRFEKKKPYHSWISTSKARLITMLQWLAAPFLQSESYSSLWAIGNGLGTKVSLGKLTGHHLNLLRGAILHNSCSCVKSWAKTLPLQQNTEAWDTDVGSPKKGRS